MSLYKQRKMTLCEVYIQHLERMLKEGKPTLQHECPHCVQIVVTQCPPRGEIWDSMRICPHCDGMYFYVAYSDSERVDVAAVEFP